MVFNFEKQQILHKSQKLNNLAIRVWLYHSGPYIIFQKYNKIEKNWFPQNLKAKQIPEYTSQILSAS